MLASCAYLVVYGLGVHNLVYLLLWSSLTQSQAAQTIINTSLLLLLFLFFCVQTHQITTYIGNNPLIKADDIRIEHAIVNYLF